MRIRGVVIYRFIALHLSLNEGADFLNFTLYSYLKVCLELRLGWGWQIALRNPSLGQAPKVLNTRSGVAKVSPGALHHIIPTYLQ